MLQERHCAGPWNYTLRWPYQRAGQQTLYETREQRLSMWHMAATCCSVGQPQRDWSAGAAAGVAQQQANTDELVMLATFRPVAATLRGMLCPTQDDMEASSTQLGALLALLRREHGNIQMVLMQLTYELFVQSKHLSSAIAAVRLDRLRRGLFRSRAGGMTGIRMHKLAKDDVLKLFGSVGGIRKQCVLHLQSLLHFLQLSRGDHNAPLAAFDAMAQDVVKSWTFSWHGV